MSGAEPVLSLSRRRYHAPFSQRIAPTPLRQASAGGRRTIEETIKLHEEEMKQQAAWRPRPNKSSRSDATLNSIREVTRASAPISTSVCGLVWFPFGKLAGEPANPSQPTPSSISKQNPILGYNRGIQTVFECRFHKVRFVPLKHKKDPYRAGWDVPADAQSTGGVQRNLFSCACRVTPADWLR